MNTPTTINTNPMPNISHKLPLLTQANPNKPSKQQQTASNKV
jgi:hypothetical protein